MTVRSAINHCDGGARYSVQSPLWFLGILGLSNFPFSAWAEDCDAPCGGYEISVEIQSDSTFAADPASSTSNIVQPSITAVFFVLPVESIGVLGSVTTEPVNDLAFGDSAHFEGIGTYVEELYALVEADAVTMRIGKFDPIFSLAGEILPGINATELASTYDADERLGGEVSFGFEGFGLNHTLAATAFTTDRSVLSGSFFTEREQARLSDGGAGNTKGLSSFSAVLSGCEGADRWDCYFEGEFGYRVAFRYQKEGQSLEEEDELGRAPRDETAYFAAATRNVELDEMTLGLLGETAYLKHFEGGPDDALFVTGSAALNLGALSYIATYTHQRNYVANAPDTREQLADFEAIYASEEDILFSGSVWEIGAAYTYARDAVAERHIFSLRLTVDFFGQL